VRAAAAVREAAVRAAVAREAAVRAAVAREAAVRAAVVRAAHLSPTQSSPLRWAVQIQIQIPSSPLRWIMYPAALAVLPEAEVTEGVVRQHQR